MLLLSDRTRTLKHIRAYTCIHTRVIRLWQLVNVNSAGTLTDRGRGGGWFAILYTGNKNRPSANDVCVNIVFSVIATGCNNDLITFSVTETIIFFFFFTYASSRVNVYIHVSVYIYLFIYVYYVHVRRKAWERRRRQGREVRVHDGFFYAPTGAVSTLFIRAGDAR